MSDFSIRTFNGSGRECCPATEPLPGTGNVITTRKAVYRMKLNGKRYVFIIKKGFIFDGCSVPAPLRMIATPFAPYGVRAGLLHDFLFRFNEGLHGQAFADKLFRLILIIDKAGRPRAEAMYIGVRAGGWHSWNKWRKENGTSTEH